MANNNDRPLIGAGVAPVDQLPFWPTTIVEPYMNQPVNSPGVIVANLRGCCENTLEDLQAARRGVRGASSAAPACPNIACGRLVADHIHLAEMKLAFRVHQTLFPGEWAPRALVLAVHGGWRGIARGQPGSGPVAAAQAAYMAAGGNNAVAAASAAATAAHAAALAADPMGVSGLIPVLPRIGAVVVPLPDVAPAAPHPNIIVTADTPSAQPTPTEWNMLEKLAKACKELMWQSHVSIAHEFIDTLEQEIEGVPVPPTAYVHFLKMMLDKVKHDRMIKWVQSTLIKPGPGLPSLSWNACKTAFKEQYGDVNAMTLLRERHRTFTQGKLSVPDYCEEYQRLSRLISREFQDDNKSNMDAFIRGLNSDIRTLLVAVRTAERNKPAAQGGDKHWDWTTLTELCQAAINTAANAADSKHFTHPREKSRSDQYGHKRKPDQPMKPNVKTGLSCPKHPHLENHTWDDCKENPHRKGKSVQANKEKKHRSGSFKHARARSHSPSLAQASPSASSVSTPVGEKADKKSSINNDSLTGVTCFKCGEKGHMAPTCPKKREQGAAERTRSRSPSARGINANPRNRAPAKRARDE